MTAPRWLGASQPDLQRLSDLSAYPEEGVDGARRSSLPATPTRRSRSYMSLITESPTKLPMPKRDSESLFDRIARSFSSNFALAGLGVGIPGRSRESVNLDSGNESTTRDR